MKNNYLLALASMAVLAAAQPAAAQRAGVPIPGVPVRQQFVNSRQAQSAMQQFMHPFQQDRKRLAQARQRIKTMTPEQVREQSARRQAQRHEAMPTRQMNVLTGIDHYTPDDGKTVRQNFHYDRFGRVVESYDENDRSSYYKNNYVYTDDAAGRWTEHTQTYVPGDGSPAYTWMKESRTLGDNGLVLDACEWNTWKDNAGEPHLALTRERHYEPLVGDPALPVMTQEMKYTKDSLHRVAYSYACKWFDYGQFYFSADNEHGRTKININGSTAQWIGYGYGVGGKEEIESIVTYYYDTDPVTNDVYQIGSLSQNYLFGAEHSAEGWLLEMQYNTPEQGFYTFIRKEWQNGEWVPERKIECNFNYMNDTFSHVPYEKNYVISVYTVSDGQYVPYYTDRYQWEAHNIQQFTRYNDVGGYESIFITQRYSDEGELIGKYAWLVDGGYVVQTEDDAYTYYSYYDNDDHLLHEFRHIADADNIAHKASTRQLWYEVKENGLWTSAAGRTIDMYGYPYLERCFFDDKGRLAKADVYQDENTLSGSYVYTYYDDQPADGIDNGYGVLYSIYDPESPAHDVAYKSLDMYYTDEKGRSVHTEQQWGRNDVLLSGWTKTVDDPRGRTDTYSYKNGRWVWASAVSNDLVTDAVVDGLNRHTVIQNNIDNTENGGVYPSTKTVTITSPTDPTLEGSETYRMVDGQWGGDYKRIGWMVTQPAFHYTIPEANGLDNEYCPYLMDREYSDGLQSYQRSCSKQYKWTDGQWKMYSLNDFEYTLDGNAISYKRTSVDFSVTEQYLDQTVTSGHTIVRDDKGRLLSDLYEFSEQLGTITEQTKKRLNQYTYNADGLVGTHSYDSSEYTIDDDYDNGQTTNVRYTDTYHYAVTDVVDGINTIHTGVALPFTLNGRTISAHTAITLYNVQGQQVAASAEGSVTAPAPGLYIVSDGSARVKVLVK